MKTLSLRYEDKEYHKLKKEKDKSNLSWERFVLSLLKGGKDGKSNKDKKREIRTNKKRSR